MTSNLRKNPTIFLYAHSQYRGIFTALAKVLKARLGATIHLFCVTPQEEKYYREKCTHQRVFDSVIVCDALYARARDPVGDESALIRAARRNEAFLGTTINDIAVTDRHLGRGYALGGFYHPRSRISENTNYLQMVHGFNEQINFWRRQFEEKQPDIMINGGKVGALMCRALGVTFRTLAGSRYKNLHQWAHNEFHENPRVESAYRKLEKEENAGAEENATIDNPYYAHMTNRGQFERQTSRVGLAKHIGLQTMRHAYWRLRGYEKAKGYYLSEEIHYLLRQRRNTVRLSGRSPSGETTPLSALGEQEFVYYPMHTEPEGALQTLSPEYFYQLPCIAAISRDLPAGTKLVVKETFAAIGRRPDNFYDQIRDFKNVVMLDMMELGLDVVRQCSAVVTITGTGGFEAAVLGKPVITFGRHNQYNFLPHVRVVTDETRLKGYLHDALEIRTNQGQATRDGARFLRAVRSISFDLGDYDFIYPERFDPKVVESAVRSLVESLNLESIPFSKTGLTVSDANR